MRSKLPIHLGDERVVMYIREIALSCRHETAEFVGCNLETVEAIECAHIIEVPLECRQIEFLTEDQHAGIFVASLCLDTP